MTDFVHIPDLAALLSDIPPDSIVSRTVLNEKSVRAILFGFAPGQELTEHRTPMAAILHILAGEGRLTLGQEEVEVKPGAFVYMPPNLPHSVLARTELHMLLTMVQEKTAQAEAGA